MIYIKLAFNFIKLFFCFVLFDKELILKYLNYQIKFTLYRIT